MVGVVGFAHSLGGGAQLQMIEASAFSSGRAEEERRGQRRKTSDDGKSASPPDSTDVILKFSLTHTHTHGLTENQLGSKIGERRKKRNTHARSTKQQHAPMPLGFSVGEWIVTVGVVVVAFGPKDIPVIARGLGKLTGQAVGKDGTTTHAQQKRRRKRTHLVFILGMPTSDSPHTTHVISPLSNSLSLSLSLSIAYSREP